MKMQLSDTALWGAKRLFESSKWRENRSAQHHFNLATELYRPGMPRSFPKFSYEWIVFSIVAYYAWFVTKISKVKKIASS